MDINDLRIATTLLSFAAFIGIVVIAKDEHTGSHVQQAMAKVKVADAFDNFAGKAATFGLIKKEDAQLDNYVTGKALDGL